MVAVGEIRQVAAQELVSLVAQPARSADDRDGRFEQIVRRHSQDVRRLALRLLGWPQDVDDVVQEVFVAVWQHLPRFRGDSSVQTWLTRITINQCRRHRRSRLLRWAKHRDAADAMAQQTPGLGVGPQQAAVDRDTCQQVRQAVRALPSGDREVIVLRYLQELPISEICQLLNLPRNTVDVRLHRARAKLNKTLSELITP